MIVFYKVRDDRPEPSSKYSKYHINDSKCDFSDIDEYFSDSYGVSFFFKLRQKHYNLMNEQVFEELSQLRNKNETGSNSLDFLKLVLDITSISILYRC